MIHSFGGRIFSFFFAVLLLIPIPGLSCSLGKESYICLIIWIVLGLVFLAAVGLLYFDYLAASALAPMLRLPVAAICFIVLAVAMYAFSLHARYENSLGATLKNAVSLAVGFFPRTLAMVLFATVLWLLSIRYYRFGVPILLMFGFSLPCYVNALLTMGVFDKLES